MLVGDISITDMLFPVVIVAIWALLFMLVFFISRWALHDHDAHAEDEERAHQGGSDHGPTMTPLPS